MALMHVDFFSDVLGMGMDMDVLIPQKTFKQIGMEGSASGGRYKTMYLLHGMSDDQTTWMRRTSIERYVSSLGIAVVMPTTHLGFYTDTQYLFHTLKDTVNKKFDASLDFSDKAVVYLNFLFLCAIFHFDRIMDYYLFN